MKKFVYLIVLIAGLSLTSCERSSCYFISITLEFPDGRTRTQQVYAYGTEEDARIKCDMESRKLISEYGVDSAWIYSAYERLRGISEDDCRFGENGVALRR